MVSCIFKTHLLGLSQTVTRGHLLFSNGSIGSQLNFTALSEPSIKFTSFFTVVIQVTLLLFWLFFMKDIVQNTTVQIKSSWRFLSSVHLYINLKKKHFGQSFAFDTPML